MNLQRHRDGTYSLSELSRSDVANLMFAASAAGAFLARNPTDDQWDGRRRALFDRLYWELSYLERACNAHAVHLIGDDMAHAGDVYSRRPKADAR